MTTVISSFNQREITPDEQYERLCLPIAKEVEAVTRIAFNAATIIAQYAPDESPLTAWHRSFMRLAQVCPEVLPTTIPPIPPNLLQHLDNKCPVNGHLNRPDGTPCKVKHTHILTLFLKEFGSVNDFEIILKKYGIKNYPENTNPLLFKSFYNLTRQDHGATLPSHTHWGLTVLIPKSMNKTWKDQVALVKAISTQSIPYTIPTLQESYVSFATHMLGTGKNIYAFWTKNEGIPSDVPPQDTFCNKMSVGFMAFASKFCNREFVRRDTYIRVAEQSQDCHLVIGGHPNSHVTIDHFSDCGNFYIAAMCTSNIAKATISSLV